MSRKPGQTIIYKYRGDVERGSPNKGYRWHPGYSADGPSGGVLYPWMTYRECQRDAAAQGCKAVFVKKA
jgi:hypothetical protein